MRSNDNDISILFIPFGSPKVAATRYRVSQYLPYLAERNIRYKVFSSISERTTGRMIESPNFRSIKKYMYYLQIVLEKLVRFCPILYLAAQYKIVFLQRTTFLFGLEKVLKIVNKNIIFDIDDSIYMPDTEEGGIIGWLKRYTKKSEVVSILKIAKCVIAENNHIKNFVQKYYSRIYIITGPIDITRNYAREERPDLGELVIGWIGSPATTLYLKLLDNVLKELSKRYKVKFKLIGASSYAIDGVNVETVDWNYDTEISQLHTFDIGVMPMPDNEWTRGKVGCKMLQYMSNAIPSVVSYTPTNAEVIEDGLNGFIASSEGEWIEKLSRLIKDKELRYRIGLAGRKSVLEKYSIQANLPRYLEIFKSCPSL